MNARAGLTPRKINTILVASRIVVGVFFAFLTLRPTIAMSQGQMLRLKAPPKMSLSLRRTCSS